MNKTKLENLILSLTQDVIFTFNNKEFCINPYSKSEFEVGTDDEVLTFDNIDSLMSAEIFDGKCLNEIAQSIKIA